MLCKTLRLVVLAGALSGLSDLWGSQDLQAASPACARCRDAGVLGGSVVDGDSGARNGRPSMVCRDREYGQPDLFYNFYAPGTCGGIPAELYIAPRPVPANVGHTYFTYQPLMPHEMLYRHSRVYHRSYEGGRGLTRTSVKWW